MFIGLVALLYLGRYIFIPLAYGLLVALVLHPVVVRLEARGVPGWAAIGMGLVMVGLLFGLLLGLLVFQLNVFLADLPVLMQGGNTDAKAIWAWMNKVLAELGGTHHDEWWAPLINALPGRVAPYLGTVLSALFGMLFNLFIIPVFSALLLYHRRTYVAVVSGLVGQAWAPRLPALLHKVTGNFAKFIGGMLQVYLIVGTLNCLGFLLLGVPNAILFGMLTAIATMIPYAGIIISALLPITLAWTTSGTMWTPVGVIAVLAVVQYLEANLIFPKVVGGRLGLSTLSSLLAIFAGGLIWGVAGMILFLPFLSIVKLLCEEVPEWAPLGLLLSGEKKP
ncbi:MAG: AI-2E family transporter [Flavobacteriales bacterium]